MATKVTRDARPSLPALLALLLALIAGLSAPPLSTGRVEPRTTASAAVTWHSGTSTEVAATPAPTEPPPAPVAADHCTTTPAAGRERVLRPQLVVAVGAARAPPAATV